MSCLKKKGQIIKKRLTVAGQAFSLPVGALVSY